MCDMKYDSPMESNVVEFGVTRAFTNYVVHEETLGAATVFW